jgi:hypothetical protein
MLRVNDKLRFNIDQVVNHPYFKKDGLVSDRSCFVKQPKIFKNINIDKSGVQKIIDIAKKEFESRPCYILFMALDIYIRFVNNLEEYKEKKEILNTLTDLPYMCLLIANKYFYWSEFDVDTYIDKIEKRIFEENLIYKIINGCIRDERYFKNCKNTNEVKFVFDYFFGSNCKNVNEYLMYDGEDFMNEHRVKGNDTNTFALYIKDL